MYIVGVDNSVNSPGVVWFELGENLEIIKRDYLGFTMVKKNSNDNIIYFKKTQFNNSVHQYLWMRDVIINKLFEKNKSYPEYVAFEDYAFSAKGKTFNIAESTGALKVSFYKHDSKIRLYDPASIKLFSTGYGNSDKVRMKDEYFKLKQDQTLIGEVNEDIIDAYFITNLLYLEILIRNFMLKVDSLPEHKSRVFKRVTKAYPQNLLNRNFIWKGSDEK